MKLSGYEYSSVALFLIWLCRTVLCCNRSPPKLVLQNQATFQEPIVTGNLDNGIINEVSGIAQSRRHQDVLYVLNDSGGMPRLFALNATTAHLIAVLNIKGALNCDWEDIAVGTGPYGLSYIYIGDIGGNTKSTCNTLYRVVEPLKIQDCDLEIHGELQFTWDAPNCETLLVDQDGMLYMVSKVYSGSVPKLYQVPNMAWRYKKITLDEGTAIAITVNSVSDQPVAGDISHSGKEILIKTYQSIYYWKRSLETSLQEVLQKPPTLLPYMVEPQGEAICWSKDDKGYFTASEGPNPPLYYYAKNQNIN